jgi:tRNA(Ile)-lysidine synthase
MRGAHPERALERDVARRVAAEAGETLVAAVSGGIDSTALAGLLAAHAAQAGARLILAHVNHRTRADAFQDEAVVLALGAALGIRVTACSLPEGPADEARLREERYAALRAMAGNLGARRVFTAHNAEDQTETVLLALFRGTGPDALRGMPARRSLGEDCSLERPLLRVPRKELAAYCTRLHLPVVVDASNRDERYRRNALRSALAGLRPSFPHLDEAVARCAEIAAQEAAQTPRAVLRSHLRERLRAEARGGDALLNISFERWDAAAAALEAGRRGRHFLKAGLHVKIT